MPPMTVCAVLLAAGAGSRFEGDVHKLRAELAGRPILRWSLDAMLAADVDEYVVVVGGEDFSDIIDDDVTVIENPAWREGQAHSLQNAISHARSAGHSAIVVGVADQPLVDGRAWQRVAATKDTPIAIAGVAGQQRPPTRLHGSVWEQLPATGDEGARVLMKQRPDLVTVVDVPGEADDVDTAAALERVRGKVRDRERVTELLGRRPQGRFDVVVRTEEGDPVVLRNHPVLDDGRPMPTLYWLCGEREQVLVGRLESVKGVQRAEAELGLEVIAEAHERYRAERDAFVAELGVDIVHPPTGGVGGTRQGVKCLHAHYGWWLAGGDDPVGRWVHNHLDEVS